MISFRLIEAKPQGRRNAIPPRSSMKRIRVIVITFCGHYSGHRDQRFRAIASRVPQ
jgi:hypothetical protein